MENASRGGCVEAHETLSALAEHLAVVEGETGALDEEVNELLVVEAEVAAVEPYEEGGLRAPWFYLWDILAAVVDDKVDVAFDVAQHLLAPLLSLGSDCQTRRRRSDIPAYSVPHKRRAAARGYL